MDKAILRRVDGKLVLDDPAALAVTAAVAKHNCRNTVTMNADRVRHFSQRIVERGLSAADVVIVLLNVDDVNGRALAEHLMPGQDWQAIRDRGEIPFARGLAARDGVQSLVSELDAGSGTTLSAITGVAVVVMDHGVVEVFDAMTVNP